MKQPRAGPPIVAWVFTFLLLVWVTQSSYTALQAGQSHPPTAFSGRRSFQSARAHASGGLETIPSGLSVSRSSLLAAALLASAIYASTLVRNSHGSDNEAGVAQMMLHACAGQNAV